MIAKCGTITKIVDSGKKGVIWENLNYFWTYTNISSQYLFKYIKALNDKISAVP